MAIINVPAGSLVFKGPARASSLTARPGEGGLALSGLAPSLMVAVTLSVGAGGLALAGPAPAVRQNHLAQPAAGTLTLAGQTPSLNRTYRATPAAGTLTLTGQAPTLPVVGVWTPGAGNLTLIGPAPAAVIRFTVTPAAGDLTLAGQAPALALGIVPAAGALGLTGYAPTVTSTPDLYPLRVHASGRYLIDQTDAPYLIVGDSPQGMLVDLSESEMDTYLANRAGKGINSIQVHAIAGATFGGHADRSTYDNIAPFSTPGDISTPNEAYFARLDTLLAKAASQGICVWLTAAEYIDSADLFAANGTTKCYNFGVYLGNRYKDVPNIVWNYGNDLQDPSTYEAYFTNVRDGVASVDTNHLHTNWLDFLDSLGTDRTAWQSRIDINQVYTYYPTYVTTTAGYAYSPTMPTYLTESNYEAEGLSGYTTTDWHIRKQAWWAVLSGACGHFYCNDDIWKFVTGWATGLDTYAGLDDLQWLTALADEWNWETWVPDASNAIVTAGYGTKITARDTGSIDTNDYATTCANPAHSVVISYIPTQRTVTVAMDQVDGLTARCRWYNPRAGGYTAIGTYATSGTRDFTPPDTNDWVLVIDTADFGEAFTPDTGALTLAGQTPALRVAYLVSPSTGALALDGLSPQAFATILAQPGVGLLTLVGQAPTLGRTYLATPQAGALTLDGQSPQAFATILAQPDAGTLTLSGQAPVATATDHHSLTVPPGSLTLIGATPTLSRQFTSAVPSGAVSLSGFEPSLVINVVVAVPAGALTVDGTIPAFDYGLGVPAGTLVLAGTTPELAMGLLEVPAGTLTIAGLAPNLVLQPLPSVLYLGVGGSGTITLTGGGTATIGLTGGAGDVG